MCPNLRRPCAPNNSRIMEHGRGISVLESKIKARKRQKPWREWQQADQSPPPTSHPASSVHTPPAAAHGWRGQALSACAPAFLQYSRIGPGRKRPGGPFCEPKGRSCEFSERGGSESYRSVAELSGGRRLQRRRVASVGSSCGVRMAKASGGSGPAFLISVVAVCVLWAAAAEARSPAARAHRHLKRLNKPAVKSIQVPHCPWNLHKWASYFEMSSKLRCHCSEIGSLFRDADLLSLGLLVLFFFPSSDCLCIFSSIW